MNLLLWSRETKPEFRNQLYFVRSNLWRSRLFPDSFSPNSFKNLGNALPLLNNTEDEKQDIKLFMKEMFEKTSANTIDFPPVTDNGDLATVGYACEVMKWFKPALTVVNMNNVDGCHSDFTGYLRSLHRADHGLGL